MRKVAKPERPKPPKNPVLDRALSQLLAATLRRPPGKERDELALLCRKPDRLVENKDRILFLCKRLDLYAEKVLTGQELSGAVADTFEQEWEVDAWV